MEIWPFLNTYQWSNWSEKNFKAVFFSKKVSQFSMFDGNNSTRGGVISVILFISSSDTIEEDLPPGGGGQIKKVHMMKNVVGHKCVENAYALLLVWWFTLLIFVKFWTRSWSGWNRPDPEHCYIPTYLKVSPLLYLERLYLSWTPATTEASRLSGTRSKVSLNERLPYPRAGTRLSSLVSRF